MRHKFKFGKRLLAVLLCLSMLLPMLCFGGTVSAAEPENTYKYSSDLSEFASDVTIYDEDLQEVGTNGTVYFGKTYDLIVTFTESAGDENEAGKQFKYIDDPDDPHYGWLAYELPGSICSVASESEVMITRNDGTKVPIGTFFTDDEGHAYVQFGAYDKYGKPIEDGTNFIDYYPDATFTLKFSCTVLDNGEPGDKTLDLGDDLHITVHVVNEGDLDVTKTADKYDYATDTITYHAHVAAVNGTVTDTTITDTATSGQLIDPNSFVILDQDGNDVTTNFTPVVNGASFTIELGEMLAETFYDITYRTQIPATAQGDTVWFDNSCVVNGTDLRGNPTEDTAHFGQNVAFFRVMKKGDQTMLPVTENGVMQNKTAVKWSVTAENGRGTIGAATLADTPDGHQTLYTQGDSLALSWINADHRGGTINIPWSEVTLSPDGSSFSLDLPIVDPARGIDTSDAIQYVMTYYTLTDIADGSVSNTAIFTDEYGHGDTETQSINLISGTAAVTKTVQLSDDDNYLNFVVVCNVPANRTDLPNFYISDTAFFSTPPLYVQRFAQPALFENLTISVDVMDANNTHIDMTPYVPGSADTENTFYVQYPNAGQANIYFNGVTGGGWDSRWHIAEPSVITLKYSLPLDSPVLDNRYALTGMTVRQMLAEGERFENDATLAYGSGAAIFTRVYYTAPVQKTCKETTDETTGEPIFHYQVELLPTSGQDKNFGACIFNTKDENGKKVADVTTISFIDEFDDRYEYVPGSLKCSMRYSYTQGIAEFNYAGNATFSGGRIEANFADFTVGTYDRRYLTPNSTLKLTIDEVDVIPFIYDFTYDLRLKDAEHPDENVLHLHNTAWFEWDNVHSTPPVDCEVQHRTNLINKGYVQDGDQVAFTIEVNPTGKDLLEGVDTITLKDTMSENLSVFWDSLHVLYLNKAGEWVEISHVDSNATYIPEENAVMVTIPDETYVKIEYNTLITEIGNNVSIGNTVTVVGYGSFSDVIESTFVVSKSDASASAGTGHFTLIKNGSDGVRLSGAVFDLYSADSSKAQTAPEGTDAQITVNVGETPTDMYYVGTYTTGADGTAFVENVALEDDHYFALIETQAPAGYLPLAEPFVFNFNPNALSRQTGGMPQVSNLHAITDAAIVPDKVVIDYGLPVEIHPLGNDYLSRHITGIASSVAADTKLFNVAYDASRLAGNYTALTGESNKIQLVHGTAYLTESGTIIYTPTDMQMSTEDVIFYEYTAQNGEIFYSTVTVIPAANMYYEFPAGTQYYPQDYIMFNNGTGYSWEDVGATYDRMQAEDRPGEASLFDGNNVYGYDPAYNDTNAVTYSMGSAKKATVNADTLYKEPTMEFTFCGTGFDFFSVTDNCSGVMLCQVIDAAHDKQVKSFLVNNFYGYTYAPACFDTVTGEQSKTGIQMYKMPSGILPEDSEELKAALPFLDKACGREVWEISTYWTDSTKTELTMVKTDYPAYAEDKDGLRRYIASGHTTTTEETGNVLYFAPYVRYTDYTLIWSIPTYRNADGTVTYTATDDPMTAYGWFADGDDGGCLYQVPVVRCRDLDYGTYRVLVTPRYVERMDSTHSGSYSVCVDAVRIYNPAATAPATDSIIGSAYLADKEYQPEYKEIRKNMLDADSFYAGTDTDSKNDVSAGFTFIDGISALDVSASGSISNLYLHSGPNNELYLAKDQAVACYVRCDAATAPAALQLGMKAITGSTGTLTVYNSHTKSFAEINVAGSSEQYRELLPYITWDQNLLKQGIYQSADPLLLVNLSDTMISLTNFKSAYDHSKPIRSQSRTQYVSTKEIARDINALLLQLPADHPQMQGDDLSYTAASVTLKSDLSLNFFVPEEKASQFTGVYALFSKAIYDDVGNVTCTVNYPVYNYTLQEINGVQCRCYVFNGIAPQEISSEVTAELFGIRDGSPYHGSALTYSVLTYAQNMLGRTDDAALRTLLIDLLNYGAAAQGYTSYRTGSLANAGLSAEQQARANSYLTLPASCTQISSEQDAAVSFRSATLILKDKISICVCLNVDSSITDLYDLEAVFTFTDVSGKQTQSIVSGHNFIPNQGSCTVTFDGLNAALLRTPVTVTIRNVSSGVMLSNTLTYSVESYTASMQSSSDALLTNLLRSMMNYGDSAAAFVQSLEAAE